MTDNKVVPLRQREAHSDDGARTLHTRMREMLVEHSLRGKECEALFDEREFARRFCVTWPRRDREALLDFQREVHLSDQQIRRLNRSASLKWHEGRIEVTGPLWIAVGGYYNIAVIWLVLGVLLWAGAHRHGYSPSAMAIWGAGSLLLGVMSRYMWLHSVFPYKIGKRVNNVRAEQAQSERTKVRRVA